MILLLILAVFIYFINPRIYRYEYNRNIKKFKALNIDGVVISKYIDKDDHGARILRFSNFSSNSITWYYSADVTDIYDLINIGDTVVKLIDSDSILIKNCDIDTSILVEFRDKPY